MDNPAAVEAFGFTMPTPAYLIGAILFGIIGYAAYKHGKKTGRPRVRWIGLGLMVYPYAISQTWLLYVVGGGLCAAIYWYGE